MHERWGRFALPIQPNSSGQSALHQADTRPSPCILAMTANLDGGCFAFNSKGGNR